jgi:hypothetical protein
MPSRDHGSASAINSTAGEVMVGKLTGMAGIVRKSRVFPTQLLFLGFDVETAT